MKQLILAAFVLWNGLCMAQVKIGNNPTAITPNTNLEIESSNGTKVVVTTDDGRVGIGTTNPDSKLHVVGNVKITDGTEGEAKVLTSDANGLASWQPTAPCVAGPTSPVSVYRQPSDYIIAGDTFTDIPGLSAPLQAGKTYRIEFLGNSEAVNPVYASIHELTYHIKYGNNTTDIEKLTGSFIINSQIWGQADSDIRGYTMSKNNLYYTTHQVLSVGSTNIIISGTPQTFTCYIKTNTAQTFTIQANNRLTKYDGTFQPQSTSFYTYGSVKSYKGALMIVELLD
ncbi:hypothetical protein CLV98_1324 [Dyadobacter jejuensis]|uniref:Uncharacterized protein n=1 Tax=Dyadobacter jejuensis TaxID=1082580 RepID=A0A316A439_9BACT|nr:hypothetical protein [Dyadobacter jejuensis]PWJ52746.1 hypothetical protein CLV98_1324 [Dyadobacter jejuensis]